MDVDYFIGRTKSYPVPVFKNEYFISVSRCKVDVMQDTYHTVSTVCQLTCHRKNLLLIKKIQPGSGFIQKQHPTWADRISGQSPEPAVPAAAHPLKRVL